MENKKPLTSEEVDLMLSEIARGVMDDTIKPAKAKEANNALGKLISKGIGQLQASIHLGVSMEIPVLGINDSVLENQILPQRRISAAKQGNGYLDNCR